jgi:hypothetical protein
MNRHLIAKIFCVLAAAFLSLLLYVVATTAPADSPTYAEPPAAFIFAALVFAFGGLAPVALISGAEDERRCYPLRHAHHESNVLCLRR